MTLVTNGRLITRDPEGQGYYEHGAVAYEGTKIVEIGEEAALRAKYPEAEIIDAKVLSNRRPPYGITGGLYDALKATGGEFFVSTNAMARKARKLFHELEGVDIYSAAGVALASLINAVAAGKVEKDATVMLNVTGGGEEHFKEGKELWYLRPSHVFPLEPDTDDVVAKVEALFN